MNLQLSNWHFAKTHPAKLEPRKRQFRNFTSMNLVVLNSPQYQEESLIVQSLRTPSNALPSKWIAENVQYRKTSSSQPLGSSESSAKSVLSWSVAMGSIVAAKLDPKAIHHDQPLLAGCRRSAMPFLLFRFKQRTGHHSSQHVTILKGVRSRGDHSVLRASTVQP